MKNRHRLPGNPGLLPLLALIFLLVFTPFPGGTLRAAGNPGTLQTITGDGAFTNGAGKSAQALTANPGASSAGRGIADNALQSPESSRDFEQMTLPIITLVCFVIFFCLLLAKSLPEYLSLRNQRLRYQSSHDKLTGLINHDEFATRVDRAISHAQTQSVTHALLHIDVDSFNSVNTAFGHTAGDEFLQELAQLLLSSVRNRDTLSRLGEDEFGMLLENCPL